jgi:hypothetical protein
MKKFGRQMKKFGRQVKKFGRQQDETKDETRHTSFWRKIRSTRKAALATVANHGCLKLP